MQALEDHMQQYVALDPARRHEMLLADQSGRIIKRVRSDKEEIFFEGTSYPHPEELGEETVLGKACLIDEHEYVVPIIKPLHMVPLQRFMQKGIGLSACALLLFGVLLFHLNRSGEERKKIIRENRYLQELNEAMGELAREREQRNMSILIWSGRSLCGWSP